MYIVLNVNIKYEILHKVMLKKLPNTFAMFVQAILENSLKMDNVFFYKMLYKVTVQQ